MGKKSDYYKKQSEEQKAARKHFSDEYNNLPADVRVITGRVYAQVRIQQLLFERDRLVSRHSKSLREVDEHIKTLQSHLDREYKKSKSD